MHKRAVAYVLTGRWILLALGTGKSKLTSAKVCRVGYFGLGRFVQSLSTCSLISTELDLNSCPP
jgi:hypothetical protein